MKFASIIHHASTAFGPIVDDELVDVSTHLPTLAGAIDLDRRDELTSAVATGRRIALSTATCLPSIPRPERILCIGVNYAAHRAESDRSHDSEHPVVFTRFPSSLVGHEQPIVRPPVSDHFDYEGELAVVVGRRCRYVTRERALDVVAGYSCFMDGPLRDFQRHTSQFTPGKTFDRSGAFGPFIVGADELPDASNLTLRTLVNGEEMQNAYCSTFTTLEPGDVIATGTPGGVGYARTPPRLLVPGDVSLL